MVPSDFGGESLHSPNPVWPETCPIGLEQLQQSPQPPLKERTTQCRVCDCDRSSQWTRSRAHTSSLSCTKPTPTTISKTCNGGYTTRRNALRSHSDFPTCRESPKIPLWNTCFPRCLPTKPENNLARMLIHTSSSTPVLKTGQTHRTTPPPRRNTNPNLCTPVPIPTEPTLPPRKSLPSPPQRSPPSR